MKVTIGLPFYNNEETLADAIRSVFAQSFQDWELILIDDGSHDGSREIADSVSDSRVRVIGDSSNKGLAARLNQVTVLARGEFVARMDADDMMHPRRLEDQLRLLETHRDIDVVGSAMYSMNDRYVIHGIRGNHPPQMTSHDALARGILVHVTVVARRRWFATHRYDTSLRRAQDRDLWCRTCLNSKFSVTDRPLMYVRETCRDQAVTNYLNGCRSDRALMRKYGPAYVGKLDTYKLIGKSYLKSAAHRMAHTLGVYNALVKRRNTPLPPDEQQAATKVLQEIRQWRVPGLASASPAVGGSCLSLRKTA